MDAAVAEIKKPVARRFTAKKTSLAWPPSPPTTGRSATSSPTPSRRWARTAWSTSRNPRPSAWSSSSPRACSSTRATSRPYFVTNAERMEAVLEDPYILIANQKIGSVQDLLPVLEKVMQSGQALCSSSPRTSRARRSPPSSSTSCAAPSPASPSRPPASAIAASACWKTSPSSPAARSSPKSWVSSWTNTDCRQLGRARKIVVTKDDTTIIDGGGELDQIKARINQIKAEIENTDSDFDREKLQERLAKLAGGVAVIKVGAATETEIKEKKHRVEDALSATRAALEEGIVPGGGVAQSTPSPRSGRQGRGRRTYRGATSSRGPSRSRYANWRTMPVWKVPWSSTRSRPAPRAWG